MVQFALTKDLLTGIYDIDEDHRVLIELGNKVLNLDFINTNRTTFEESLSLLDSYTIFHFTAEEQVMIETGYPGLEHHRSFHERFHSEIFEYVNRVKMDGMSKELMVKISMSLENLVMEHMRITDHDFAKYLQQRQNTSVKLPDIHTVKNIVKLSEDFNEGIVNAKKYLNKH
jgi:hemerythrin